MSSTTLSAEVLAAKSSDLCVRARSPYWSGLSRSDAAEFLRAFEVAAEAGKVTLTRKPGALYDGSPAEAAEIPAKALQELVQTGAAPGVSAALSSVRTRRLSGRRLAFLVVTALEAEKS